MFQYVFSGESEWTEQRIKQLQVLKDIALKVIDFISQFEDELVKIWNKPKFVLHSNYVITLDRIASTASPPGIGRVAMRKQRNEGPDSIVPFCVPRDDSAKHTGRSFASSMSHRSREVRHQYGNECRRWSNA